jgi:predicted transglutaminase-like cysteine proteinase
MGKGQIIAHKGNGLYDVRLTYAYRSRITARLATYTAQIAEFDTKILAETDVNKKALLKLQRASIQKLYDYYSNGMPADPTVEAWCADLTEDLSYGTVVGTIEIPGEQVTMLVRPAYNGRSIYSAARDGQLMPSIAGAPHQVLFNWMLLPGWQRHKPIYRIGTVSAIDYDANTCTVCLEPAFSSQQNLPAVDGIGVADCGATALAGAADFCSRYPTHPFCTNSDEGSEIELTTGQLAQLQAVNYDVNLNYGRQGDPSGYRTGDSWDVMAPGGAGDCEDFALTKMQLLVDNYGWSPANLKIVTGYTKTGEYHAMLGVRTSNRGLMILDVNNDPVVSSTKLPYRIDKIAMTATSWKNYTRTMASVPIEYMTCNAWAFAAGDRVVVQFIDQKWTTPKVVGFAENPEACGIDIWRHGGVYYDEISGTGAWKYSTATEAWTWGGWTVNQTPSTDSSKYQLAANAISFDLAAHQWIFGGGRSYIFCPNYRQKCQRYTTTTLSYSERADHPDPARQVGQSAWYIGTGSYLVAGARVLFCYPDYTPEDPGVPDSSSTVHDDNQFFNDTLNTWAVKQSLPYSMYLGIDFAIGGYGYIGGGDNYGGALGATFDNLYRYDPTANTWAARTDLPRNLFLAQGASVDGKGYCLLGYCTTALTGDTNATADGRDFYNTKWLSEYDPVLNTWTNKSQGIGTNNLAGAVGAMSRIWSECVSGGGGPTDSDIQEYAPATDSWTAHAFAGWSSIDNSRLAL